jgi:hypothetical protein
LELAHREAQHASEQLIEAQRDALAERDAEIERLRAEVERLRRTKRPWLTINIGGGGDTQ